MNKQLKENIKRVVGEGLSLAMKRLGISKPSSKLKSAIKKHSKKLIEDFKKEVKRKNKKNTGNPKKTKKVKRPVKSVRRKVVK